MRRETSSSSKKTSKMDILMKEIEVYNEEVALQFLGDGDKSD